MTTGRSTFWFDKQSLQGLARKLQGTPSAPPPLPTQPPAALTDTTGGDPRTEERRRLPLSRLVRSEALRSGQLPAYLAELRTLLTDSLHLRQLFFWRYDAAADQLEVLLQHPAPAEGESPAPLASEGLEGFFDTLRAAPVTHLPPLESSTLRDQLRAAKLLAEEGTAALLGPIGPVDNPVGAFLFEHSTPGGAFSRSEEQLAGTLGDILALSLEIDERSRVATEQKKVEQRLRGQRTALLGLLRSDLLTNPDPLHALKELTRAAATLLETSRAGLWLLSPDGKLSSCRVRYVVEGDHHEPGPERRADAATAYFQALRSDKALSVSDVRTDRRTRELATELVPADVRSVLEVQVRAGGRIVGVLSLEQLGRTRFWTSEDEGLAAGLAEVLGRVLEGTEKRRTELAQKARELRLRSQGEAYTSLLRTTALFTGPSEAALRAVATALARGLQVERAGVWYFSEDSAQLDCVLRTSGAGVDAGTAGPLGKEGRAPWFEALAKNELLAVDDAQRDVRTQPVLEQWLKPAAVTSLLGVPLRVGDLVAGWLFVEHVGTRRGWLPDEQQFASLLAEVTAGIIQRLT